MQFSVATVLPNLTAEDLKDLGVTLVGHRRRLLDAIAALDTGPRHPRRFAARRRAPAADGDILRSGRLKRGTSQLRRVSCPWPRQYDLQLQSARTTELDPENETGG